MTKNDPLQQTFDPSLLLLLNYLNVQISRLYWAWVKLHGEGSHEEIGDELSYEAPIVYWCLFEFAYSLQDTLVTGQSSSIQTILDSLEEKYSVSRRKLPEFPSCRTRKSYMSYYILLINSSSRFQVAKIQKP